MLFLLSWRFFITSVLDLHINTIVTQFESRASSMLSKTVEVAKIGTLVVTLGWKYFFLAKV